jgi:hypothetical protein
LNTPSYRLAHPAEVFDESAIIRATVMRAVSRTIDFAAIGAGRGFIDMSSQGLVAASAQHSTESAIRTDLPRCVQTSKVCCGTFAIDSDNHHSLYPLTSPHLVPTAPNKPLLLQWHQAPGTKHTRRVTDRCRPTTARGI